MDLLRRELGAADLDEDLVEHQVDFEIVQKVLHFMELVVLIEHSLDQQVIEDINHFLIELGVYLLFVVHQDQVHDGPHLFDVLLVKRREAHVKKELRINH